MTKVKLNPMIEGLRGTMGDMVFRVMPNGETVASKRPDMSRVKWSKAQKDHRERFKQSHEYARAAMADPEVRAIYEEKAAEEHKHPYAMALSDYFKGKDLLAKK